MTKIAELIFVVTTGTSGGGGYTAGPWSGGRLDIKLSTRKGRKSGADPEPLFVAGEAPRFEDAVGLAALRLKAVPSDDAAIDAEFDLCIVDGSHSLQARFDVRLPGLARMLADIVNSSGPDSKVAHRTIDADFDMV